METETETLPPGFGKKPWIDHGFELINESLGNSRLEREHRPCAFAAATALISKSIRQKWLTPKEQRLLFRCMTLLLTGHHPMTNVPCPSSVLVPDGVPTILDVSEKLASTFTALLDFTRQADESFCRIAMEINQYVDQLGATKDRDKRSAINELINALVLGCWLYARHTSANYLSSSTIRACLNIYRMSEGIRRDGSSDAPDLIYAYTRYNPINTGKWFMDTANAIVYEDQPFALEQIAYIAWIASAVRAVAMTRSDSSVWDPDLADAFVKERGVLINLLDSRPMMIHPDTSGRKLPVIRQVIRAIGRNFIG